MSQINLEKMEQAIRNGEFSNVRETLRGLNRSKIRRKKLLPLAEFARRTGDPKLGILFLGPIVRPSAKKTTKSTPDECAEYGMCLTHLGAYHEAVELFESIDPKVVPKVDLYYAMTLFLRWEYEKSIPKLSRFIHSQKISDYQMLIGKTNLSAALVAIQKSKEAKTLLEEIVHNADKLGNQLIRGNAFELLAQVEIHLQNYNKALEFLTKSENILKGSHIRYKIYIKKWRIISELLKEGPQRRTLTQLAQVRNLAHNHNLWEVVRDCDLQKAVITKNEKLFVHVLAGSPFPAYRERMMVRFPKKIKSFANYDWSPSFPKAGVKDYFDVVLGEDGKCQIQMRPKRLLHKLIGVLSSDFYCPFSVTYLHSEIFPKNYFDPGSTPHRIHELIRRTRELLDKHNIPIVIQSSQHGFFIQTTRPYLLRTQFQSQPIEKHQVFIKDVKYHFHEQSFSSSQIVEALRIPRRTAIRLIKLALSEGWLGSEGAGRSTRYHVVDSQNKAVNS